MAYATSDDIEFAAGGEAHLIELADQDADGDADSEVLAFAIAVAESEINGWVAKQLDVPVTSPPTKLRSLSAEMTVYYLKRYRSCLTQSDVEQHTEHLAWLRAFAAGEVVLDVDPTPPSGRGNWTCPARPPEGSGEHRSIGRGSGVRCAEARRARAGAGLPEAAASAAG